MGSYTGVMYAIEDSTGETAWSHQTGGGIMHTAAFSDGKVYFSSLDFSVYCLNVSNGERIWSYETGAELVSSPLVVNNTVYIGSRDGYFYALDAETGHLKWRYRTDGPIDQSAAYSSSRDVVIFGSDDMHVYALEDAGSQANLRWKSDKLYGQMLGPSWPVVSEQAGLVMVRTLPTYPGGDRGRIEDILCELCPEACWHPCVGDPCPDECWDDGFGGCWNKNDPNWGPQDTTCDYWLTGPGGTPGVEQRIRDLHKQNPHQRTFFALDLDSGQDVFASNPSAVPCIYRHEDVPTHPWVDGQGDIYVHFRSTSSFSTEQTYGSKFVSDIGTLNPQTGNITTLIAAASSIRTYFSGMCLDDGAVFTMGGSIIYGTHNGGTPGGRGGGALDLANDEAYCIFRDREDSNPWCGLVVFDALARSDRGTPYECCHNRGEGRSGLAIAGDTLYSTRAPYGAVVAIKGTPR